MNTIPTHMTRDEFYKTAFKGYVVPDSLRQASMHICNAYGITGICDPMYIVHVIAIHTNKINEIRSIKQ